MPWDWKPGEAVSVASSGMRFRLFKLGDFHIEVMEPLGPDGPIASFIEHHGEGLQHMTFKVRDVEQAMADLKAKGARFTSSAPVRLNSVLGPMKFAFMNPRTSNGVLIQLMELRAAAADRHRLVEPAPPGEGVQRLPLAAEPVDRRVIVGIPDGHSTQDQL